VLRLLLRHPLPQDGAGRVESNTTPINQVVFVFHLVHRDGVAATVTGPTTFTERCPELLRCRLGKRDQLG
jgi:hypothetical protein